MSVIFISDASTYNIDFHSIWYDIFIVHVYPHELMCKEFIIVVFYEQDEMLVLLCFDFVL